MTLNTVAVMSIQCLITNTVVSGNIAGMTLNTVAVMSIQCLITYLERQPKLIRLWSRPFQGQGAEAPTSIV